MEWIPIEADMPEAQSIDEHSAPYYLVLTQLNGSMKAMRLKDEDGIEGWYVSYVAKIIVPVIRWMNV
jgi:hypothetical protein